MPKTKKNNITTVGLSCENTFQKYSILYKFTVLFSFYTRRT